MVGGAGFVGALGADVGSLFHAGDVGWGRTGEEGVRALGGIEPGESASFDHEGGEAVPLRL